MALLFREPLQLLYEKGEWQRGGEDTNPAEIRIIPGKGPYYSYRGDPLDSIRQEKQLPTRV